MADRWGFRRAGNWAASRSDGWAGQWGFERADLWAVASAAWTADSKVALWVFATAAMLVAHLVERKAG